MNPRSTADLAIMGGSTLLPLNPEELVRETSLVVMASLIDVRPSVLNTQEGRFPSSDLLAANVANGRHPLSDLVAYTPVTIEVDEILATAAGPGLAVGGTTTVLVPGGTVATVLDQAAVDALGVLDVNDHSADGEHEALASAPVDYFWGHSPNVILTEGDSVVLFLDSRSNTAFKGPDIGPELVTIDPAGVFRRDGGVWRSDRAFAGPKTSQPDLWRLLAMLRGSS